MNRPWRESAGLIPWLILLLASLLIALLVKYDVITTNIDEGTKNFVDVLSKITTAIFLLVGGIFSYLKFFKGRTLSPKLVITINSGMVEQGDANLHWIEAQIENKGSVAIWNYETNIYAFFDGDFEQLIRVSECLPRPHDTKARETVIDVSEVVFEHALLTVPNQVSAISFQVEVRDQSKTVWWRSHTVSNVNERIRHPSAEKKIGNS